MFIISIITLSSCTTTEYITTTEYRDTVIYKDTTVQLYIPGDTVYNQLTLIDTVFLKEYLPQVQQLWNSDTLIIVGDFAESRSWVEVGELKAQLIEKDSVLTIELENVIRERNHWKKVYESETKIKNDDDSFASNVKQYLSYIIIILVLALLITLLRRR